jgi:hypothetical protein
MYPQPSGLSLSFQIGSDDIAECFSHPKKKSLQMKLGVRPKKESSLSSMLDSILLSYDQYSFSHWIPN